MTTERPPNLARRSAGQHWPVAIALAAGLALRVLAQLAYQPALLYIDSLKYLYNSYPGADPVGYQAALRAILAVGNLGAVTAVQHLLGPAMAVALYLVLLRRGAGRWLATLATLPLLLDAYQIQIEQTIMPDVWFEALVVGALAVLLIPAEPAPGTRSWRGLIPAVAAGLLFGASATVRQVGEILLLPALLYLVVVWGGWRTALLRVVAMTAAFAVPVIGYMAGSQLISGHFWLASSTPSVSSYGRMATAADCATLRIPSIERPLCPTARQRAYGIDWLDHDAASPLKSYNPPGGVNRYVLVSRFDRQVAMQQPGRVLAAVGRDGLKLFSLTRTSSQGGTPISRWQFQKSWPVYGNWVTLGPGHRIVLGLRLSAGSPVITRRALAPSYGGQASVNRPVATFLRSYQLRGGYTPGPLMAVFAIAGLAGSLLALARKATAGRRRLALGCLAFFATGAAVLLMSDAFQFSWRYQLPGLVTLPPAGALGLALLLSYLRSRRAPGPAAPERGPSEVASPAR
ncbi:MAG TPA: hypothetical protein VF843_12825 [Streptosporangiaceae bacterium]